MPAADRRILAAQAPAGLVPADPHRQARLRSWPQRLLHLLAIVAGWLLFWWGWHTVLARPWDSHSLVILIVGSVVMLPILTVLWILHNRRIHRSKGPRKAVPAAASGYPRDWNGRTVQADWAGLAGAHTIVVDIEGDRKIFRSADAPPAKTPGAPA